MKIAIIDSGIHPGHPHVGEVAGGISIVSADYLDRLGHGTAVAGAIREKVPDASLYAVKVFDQRLSASLETIVLALEWCIAQRMDVINLSLGTANPSHREKFERVLTAATLIVNAADFLPGSLPGVIGVAPEETCPRDLFRYRDGIFYASPYPRSIPGVPVERNLHGASFAVANMTGFVARAFAGSPRDAIRPTLIAQATNIP